MTKRTLLMTISLIAVLSLMLAACGGDDDDDATNTPAESAATSAATEAATEADMVEGDAAAGEAVYQAQCASCHTIDGSDLVGPSWQGLWMSEVELDDGTVVVADEAFITESIRDPDAKVVAGFTAGIMQPYDASAVSDEDITNIIAFMQTLQ